MIALVSCQASCLLHVGIRKWAGSISVTKYCYPRSVKSLATGHDDCCQSKSMISEDMDENVAKW